MLNASPINALALNAPQPTGGEAFDVAERMEVYLLDVGGQRVPMSSFQATMQRSGASFLQAIIPNGSEYISLLNNGQPMQVHLGYYYPQPDAFSGLATIAEAPLEQIRSDEGATRHTITISGYGQYKSDTLSQRKLKGVQTRSVNQGLRRIRSEIDQLLRPNHYAVDTDGSVFRVDKIQYFVNATSAAMEVTELYVPKAITIAFDTTDWVQYLGGDWVVAPDGTQISSAKITDDQESVMTLSVPYVASITVSYKVSSEGNYDYFVIEVNGEQVFSDSGDKSASWLSTTFEAGPSDTVQFIYRKDGSVSELDDKAYIQQISIVPA
ncbi:hypothetical protein NYA30BAC_01995 [Halomonas sp. NYA30]